jgi:hypothetical protein
VVGTHYQPPSVTKKSDDSSLVFVAVGIEAVASSFSMTAAAAPTITIGVDLRG